MPAAMATSTHQMASLCIPVAHLLLQSVTWWMLTVRLRNSLASPRFRPLLVTVDGSGTVPAPVVFDATVPSPDPTSPSCAIEFECYEGMLVEITGGSVTGPNQRFSSDPVAEVHITAAPERTFREPGIEFPGIAGLPEWDGNPEVFELDPDKLGLGNDPIPAGSHFDATGVIGFEFGGYELWPSSLTVTPATLPQAVRDTEVAEMTVGALNLFRLFDDIDDPEFPESIRRQVLSTVTPPPIPLFQPMNTCGVSPSSRAISVLY